MTAIIIPEPIGSFIAAINSHDEAAFIGAFTSTAFVDDWGTKYEGIDAISNWSDRGLLGALGTFTPESFDQDTQSIAVTGDWRSSFANGPSLFRFELAGD